MWFSVCLCEEYENLYMFSNVFVFLPVCVCISVYVCFVLLSVCVCISVNVCLYFCHSVSAETVYRNALAFFGSTF